MKQVDYIRLSTGKMLYVKYELISDSCKRFEPPSDLSLEELVELYQLLIKIFKNRLK